MDLNNYPRPNQSPVVNVVALLIVILSAILVYLANRISSDTTAIGP